MTSISPDDTFDMIDPTDYRFSRVTWVNASPAAVYELVADVANISKWSPNVTEAAYEEGAGPRVGDWFVGHNQAGERTWTTRSQVSRAEPGVAFAYVVLGIADGTVQWEWLLQESGSGCEVRQNWQLLRHNPVLGSTRADLDSVVVRGSASAEATLVALARWVAENPAG
jgi:hypothetical protein